MLLIEIFYSLVIFLIALFGIQRALLTKSGVQAVKPLDVVLPEKEQLPVITVQLPVYNEKYVVKRLIDAVCNLDYPDTKLQIQVLDDSDDETSELIARQVSDWQLKGRDITQVQRNNRKDYKPGNLAHGLEQAIGEYIAIFDADFVPQQDWLLKTIIHFYDSGNSNRLGLVQTRWGYLNADQSILTKAQALLLDDIAIQQTIRSQQELFIIFNGSAGLWKRKCIEDSGGWSGQTLCEDVELAYRAQLKGWKLKYVNQTRSMAEIPASMLDFKVQQSRWMRGYMQLARLMAKKFIYSTIAFRQKIDAIAYILSPSIYLLLTVLILSRIGLIYYPSDYVTFLDIVMLFGFLGIIAPIVLSWIRHSVAFPWNLLLMAGISLHNTIYLLSGIIGSFGGEFIRTPKQGDGNKAYSGVVNYPDNYFFSIGLELLFIIYIIVGVILSINHGQFLILPVLLVCLTGYIWVVGQSLFEYIINQN